MTLKLYARPRRACSGGPAHSAMLQGEPAESQLLAAAAGGEMQDSVLALRHLVLYQVTRYITYVAKLAVLLKKYTINFDLSSSSSLGKFSKTKKKDLGNWDVSIYKRTCHMCSRKLANLQANLQG